MKRIIENFTLILICLSSTSSFAQCLDTTNIYSFEYNDHTYELVKENKRWTEAVECAVSRNGYLAEINDVDEQNAIFNELSTNAGIIENNTQNQFGTASVWLGGSDAVEEGSWIWDGDNDGVGEQFWSGGPGGSPVGNLYTNWGTSPAEPDNSGGQDHLTMILKTTAVNFGLWNDLVATNSIYYLIEYNTIFSSLDSKLEGKASVYPNPFTNFMVVENKSSIAIERIEIHTLLGQKIKLFDDVEMENIELNVADLAKGVYVINIFFENGKLVSQKMIK